MQSAAVATIAPTGDPALSDAFKGAMRRLASGVAVIALQEEGRRYGMSATSVTSLSMTPPSLLVCISRSASLRPRLAHGTRFGINLLSEDQREVAEAFGGAAKGEDRFEKGSWSLSEGGAPALKDALAVIDCQVESLVEYGSHTIVIGKVARVGLGETADPLIYVNGTYL